MNDIPTNRIPARRARSISLPLLILVFLAGITAERFGWIPGSSAAGRVGRTFRPFWEAWDKVEKYYVDPSAANPERMTQGAIEGMLASLGDYGHTTYLSKEALQQLHNALAGNLEGIGARMTIRKQQPTIMQTMPNSPAQEAGLRPGDVLLEVDGKVVAGLPLNRVAEIVRGPAGSKVSLRVARGTQTRNLSIVRAKVDVPAVSWRMLPGLPIAHVAIQEFGKHADDQLKEVLKKARRQGAKGLVVDMRGNPGGLKEQAVAVSSEFLKSGAVFIEKERDGKQEAVPVKEGGEATDIPLVVLIDEGTASSAEIFAGAVQDHKRGKLVGTKTFGTGTVLRPFDLTDGSAVLLAVAQWLTPDGRQIWKKGISPDVEVTMPAEALMLLPDDQAKPTAADLTNSNDRQLLRALEVLQQQMSPDHREAPLAERLQPAHP
jgi:carboxyl-terminal processing protease